MKTFIIILTLSALMCPAAIYGIDEGVYPHLRAPIQIGREQEIVTRLSGALNRAIKDRVSGVNLQTVDDFLELVQDVLPREKLLVSLKENGIKLKCFENTLWIYRTEAYYLKIKCNGDIGEPNKKEIDSFNKTTKKEGYYGIGQLTNRVEIIMNIGESSARLSEFEYLSFEFNDGKIRVFKDGIAVKENLIGEIYISEEEFKDGKRFYTLSSSEGIQQDIIIGRNFLLSKMLPIIGAEKIHFQTVSVKDEDGDIEGETEGYIQNARITIKKYIFKFDGIANNLFIELLKEGRLIVVESKNQMDVYEWNSWKDKKLVGSAYFNDDGKLLQGKDTKKLYEQDGKPVALGKVVKMSDIIPILGAKSIPCYGSDDSRKAKVKIDKHVLSFSAKSNNLFYEDIKNKKIAVMAVDTLIGKEIRIIKVKDEKVLGTLFFDKKGDFLNARDMNGYSYIDDLNKNKGQGEKVTIPSYDISIPDVIPMFGLNRLDIKVQTSGQRTINFRAKRYYFRLPFNKASLLYPDFEAGHIYYIDYDYKYANKVELIRWDKNSDWGKRKVVTEIRFKIVKEENDKEEDRILDSNGKVMDLLPPGSALNLSKYDKKFAYRIINNFFATVRYISFSFLSLKKGDMYYDDFKNGRIVLCDFSNTVEICRIDNNRNVIEVLAVLYFNEKDELLNGKDGIPLEKQTITEEAIRKLMPKLASSVRLFPEPREIQAGSAAIRIEGLQYYFGRLYSGHGYKAGPLPFSKEYGGLYTPNGKLYRVFPLADPTKEGKYVAVSKLLIRPEDIEERVIFEDEEDSYVEVGKFLQAHNILIDNIEEDDIYGLLEFHRFYGIDALGLLFQEIGEPVIGVLHWLINPEIVKEMSERSKEGMSPVGASLSTMCRNYINNMDTANKAIEGWDGEIMEKLWKAVMDGLSEANEHVLMASYEGEGKLYPKNITDSQYELGLISKVLLSLYNHSYTRPMRWENTGYRFNVNLGGENYIVIVRFDTEGISQGVRINIYPFDTRYFGKDNTLGSFRLDYDEYGLGLDIETRSLNIIDRELKIDHHYIRHIPQSLQKEWPNILQALENRWFGKESDLPPKQEPPVGNNHTAQKSI